MMPRAFGLALLVLGGSACRTVPPPARAAAPPIRLVLVGTNDWHGWAKPHVTRMHDGTVVEEGGLALYAGALDILRAESPGKVLVLDAGDVFQGTLASNLGEGALMVDAFDALGMDAVAVGNHEFDYGPAGPVSVARPGDDPQGALKARIGQAHFPFLSANLTDAAGAHPAWLGNDGTVLRTVAGVRVGLLGLTTPTTPGVTQMANVANLRFGALAPVARAAAARLKAQGAEVIVAVAHAGGRCGSIADPADLTTCDPHEEIFELLEALPAGTLDAVIAGHTHHALGHVVHGTPVLETTGMGRTFGVLTLTLDASTHHVLPAATRIEAAVPLCARVAAGTDRCDPGVLRQGARLVPAQFHGQPLRAEAALAARLRPDLEAAAVAETRPLGVDLPGPLHRAADGESALGSVIGDSLRALEHADVVLLNGGGLRADLPRGPLTYGAVYEVIPFDNAVATVRLTGAELRGVLEAAAAQRTVPQVSGVAMTLSHCPGKGRLRGLTLADGRPVDPAATYRLVLPDFLARGGGGLGRAMAAIPAERVDLGAARALNLREALVGFWEARGGTLAAPTAGRIAVVPDPAECPAGSPGGRANARFP